MEPSKNFIRTEQVNPFSNVSGLSIDIKMKAIPFIMDKQPKSEKKPLVARCSVVSPTPYSGPRHQPSNSFSPKKTLFKSVSPHRRENSPQPRDTSQILSPSRRLEKFDPSHSLTMKFGNYESRLTERIKSPRLSNDRLRWPFKF